MKLYYSPGACSLSPHIALREAGLNFELVQVDLASKKTASGQNYLEINPAGYVPCLQLDDGRTLTEGPAILQYVADQVPGKLLAPANGSFERYHLQQWLNFISTELHKNFSPLFNPAASEDWRNAVRQAIAARLGVVATRFEDAPYLLGDSLSVADIYLFVVLSWGAYVNLDLSPWPALQAFMGRVGGREAVQAALRAEGLVKD
ncbi:glutathione S-transferase BphK1 [Janthinobacterium lividum]|uniref:Glutathione S-transferase, C-terminal domain n=2 Tax=Burkholderiales TaxID=80840 RepID=A1VUV4_POLNA|nr:MULTISPECIES: glutathione transferase GstA [Burkholderiales]ABM39432.1 Glutathione S-transferase, C-terminal domain [Polaromonas naphthalenivorans CJ2]ART39100.1 H225 [uncultured bacterium]OHV98975.1 glutathione S-transferase BphK2 [Janthinobacterium lividum]OHV98984.1 glutathione S-transferase BphK1 [Janthinobacterium lividum]